MRNLVAILAMIALFGLTACERDRPATQAGAAVDRAGTATGNAVGRAGQSTGNAVNRAGTWVKDKSEGE